MGQMFPSAGQCGGAGQAGQGPRSTGLHGPHPEDQPEVPRPHMGRLQREVQSGCSR